MKILHLIYRWLTAQERGGIAVIQGNYIGMGRTLGYEVEVLPLQGLNRTYENQLLARIEQARPDLIHIHDCEYRISPRLFADIVDRFPTLTTAYDVTPLCLTNRKVLPNQRFCEEPLGLGCLKQFCPGHPSWGPAAVQRMPDLGTLTTKQAWLQVLRRAKVLVFSQYMKRQYLLNGFRERDLFEVLPPLNIPLAQSLSDDGPPQTPPKLLYVGRLEKNKGVYLLPEVLARLPRGWTLEVAGAGPELDSLRRIFQTKDLAARVSLQGVKSTVDLTSLYDGATSLLIPSLVPESFCQVGLEAMARGLPVVASAGGGIIDWLESGKTGFLVPPGDPAAMADALKRLIQSPVRLRRCKQEALAKAREQYAETKVEKALAQAYEGAIADWRPPVVRRGGLDMSAAERARPVRKIQWLSPITGARVLVIAPHFDDEVLGCGGALALHRAAGHEVQVLFLTDGAVGGLQGYDRARKMRVRQAESQRALKHLGVSQMECLGLADGSLTEHPQLAQLLAGKIDEYDPEVIYAPHPGEWLPDHKAAGQAVLEATAGRAGVDLRLYEIWSPLPAVTTAADITALLELKRAAILEFNSQLSEFDYEEAVLALNAFRGRSLGENGVVYAEAFGADAPDGSEAESARPPVAVPRPTRGQGQGLRSGLGKRLVVFSESPNSPTGFGQVVKNVVLPLRQHFDLDLTVLAPQMWPEDLQAPFRVHALDQERNLLEFLEKLNFDVFFQIKDSYRNQWVSEALTSLKRRGKKFFSLLYTPVEGEICDRQLQTMRAFDHVVFYNNFAGNVVGRYDPSLVTPDRSSVITHGVNLLDYYPYSAAGRQAARQTVLPHHVVAENWFTILNVNRNYQRKDLPRSLLVLKEVLKAEPHVYLHLHTNPSAGEYELLEVAKWLGLTSRNLGFSCQNFGPDSRPLGPRVHSNAEINRLYNSADLAISTSLGEGHGFSTTEAMACRLPVVAPDNTAFRELLGAGRGFLVPCRDEVDNAQFLAYMEPCPFYPVSVESMADILVRIIRGELGAAVVAQRAFDYVQTISWRQTQAQWVNLFERILGS